MPDNSFDIVSKIDLQEVSNAIQQAMKEITTRFDLKDSKSHVELEGKDAIVMHSADEYKLKHVNDILQQKLVKRGVPLKGLVYGVVEPAAGSTAKQKITMQQGIPIEKALDSDTLIATHMNGSPLTKHHGFPARALVPGWVGAASIKWLTEIKVLESEFVGNFMSPGYRYPNQLVKPGDAVKPEDTHVLTSLNVKSVISGPLDGSSVKAGKLSIQGTAWGGESEIAKVEVSVDGGSTWNAAVLGHDQARYAWRLWRYEWKAKPGEYSIQSRATDAAGRTQPMEPAWNPSGYLYNAYDQVKVYVQA